MQDSLAENAKRLAPNGDTSDVLSMGTSREASSTITSSGPLGPLHTSMREAEATDGGQGLLPPPRLYERLAQLSGYTWDPSITPLHSVR